MSTHRSRPAGWVFRHPGRIILVVTLIVATIHVAGFLVRGLRPRIVRGDAVHYFVYARSLVYDRDLSFENDYRTLYELDFTVEPPPPGFRWTFDRTPTGLVRNYMAIGTPLAWLPAYLAVSGSVAAWNAAGGSYPADGYGLPYQLVPTVCGLVAGGFALWFTFLLCAELAPREDALAGTLAAFAGSSLLYYFMIAPAYSHALSACVSSAFFLYWWRTRQRHDLARYAVLGAIGSLMALVRWQDGLALGVALVDVMAQASPMPTARERWQFMLSRLATAAAAAALVFTPQMLAWQVLYGRPFTIPQGSDFMRWTSPEISNVLFSPLRGLVSWTPVTAAGLLSAPFLWRRSKRLALGMAGFFLASIYVNASVADWWAGEAFGARRFLSAFPIVAAGVAVLLASLPGWRAVLRGLAMALVAANLLLLLHYELFMLGYRNLASYPGTSRALWIERFELPFRLLGRLF